MSQTESVPATTQSPQVTLQPAARGTISAWRNWMEWCVPVLLCAILAAQVFFKDRRISQTADEATHLYAGYRYLKCGDFNFGREHPPLAKLAAALPLLPMKVAVNCAPGDRLDEAPSSMNWLYSQNWRTVLARGRAAVAVFALGVCLLTWIVARRMFGFRTALLAGTLLVFEPNFLANSGLITTDVALVFSLFLACFAFFLWVKHRRTTYLLLTGFAAGLTLVSKHSGVVIGPLLLVLAIADALLCSDTGDARWRVAVRNMRGLVLVAAVAVGTIWMFYGFRWDGIAAESSPAQVVAATVPNQYKSGLIPVALVQKSHLLPQEYVLGLDEGLAMARRGRPGGHPPEVLGKVLKRGQRTLLVFWAEAAIKNTVGLLCLMLLACGGLYWVVKRHRREALFLGIPAVIFLAGYLNSRMFGGVRHALPVEPFGLILVAAACVELARRVRLASVVIALVVILHAASSLHAYPHYISYANEMWGGPANLYRLLPNTDVADSYNDLREYMQQHPGQPCWLLSEFQIDPKYYGVPCQPVGFWFRENTPARMRGTVVVSSTFLNGALPRTSFSPFIGLTPKAVIGGSALLVFEGDFDTRYAAAANETLLAQTSMSQGRFDLALRHARRAAEVTPDSFPARYELCRAVIANGLLAEARQECEAAQSLAFEGGVDAQDLLRTGSGLSNAAESLGLANEQQLRADLGTINLMLYAATDHRP